MTYTVGIYLYDEVEVLDFAGPFEVFGTAARVHARQHPQDPPLFIVKTIAATRHLISARGGLQVQPHWQFHDHPHLDILLIPGGVHKHELQKPAVIAWINQTAQSTQITASVCTGAFLLAQAALLRNRRVTTHWEDIDEMQLAFPEVTVVPDQRWIDAGDIVTSAGISAGIDMSLYLVKRLVSVDLAISTARQMEYEWRNL